MWESIRVKCGRSYNSPWK